MKLKNDHRSKFQFKQLERRSLKKNQGFNGIRTHDLRVAGALLYQLSYEATHWERGQFIEFMSPERSEMNPFHLATSKMIRGNHYKLKAIVQFRIKNYR